LGKRREPAQNVRKVSAYRCPIDDGEALFRDMVSMSHDMNISLQALAKMVLQEWVVRYCNCAAKGFAANFATHGIDFATSAGRV
jgi:hypothetical protein